MKKIILLGLVFSFCQTTNAQVEGILRTLIQSGGAADTQGSFVVTGAVSVPLSASNIATQTKLLMPPTHITAEYGIFKNITAGLMLGYSATESQKFDWSDTESLLTEAQQIACDNGLGSTLGIDCDAVSTTSGSYTYTVKSVLLGLRADYHFNAGEKADLYTGVVGGYKFVTNQIEGQKPKDAGIYGIVGDQVGTAIETISKTFYVAHIGGRYYITPRWAIRAEGGYGFGLGDNLSFGGAQSLIGTFGVTYRLQLPKNQR
jgi:hypothetical protein